VQLVSFPAVDLPVSQVDRQDLLDRQATPAVVALLVMVVDREIASKGLSRRRLLSETTLERGSLWRTTGACKATLQ
jgi:hypothetical protein